MFISHENILEEESYIFSVHLLWISFCRFGIVRQM